MKREELKNKVISAISLGCDKNKVDLEKMLGRLKEYGFHICENIEDANIVIVNTCAFIQDAQAESIMNIIEVEDLKKKGILEKVIVSGCLPERNYEEIKENFPMIDAFIRLRENENICQVIENLYDVDDHKVIKKYERVLTNCPTYAYLKIADGCTNVCSFCTIPRIRGRYVSYPMDKLIDEAKNLVSRGVKEIILVAQDTTRYGEDLYKENKLIELCEKLSKIKELKWIRIHYAYPEKVTKELLDFIVKNPKMCKYLDIPLQHIDNDILVSMRRKHDESETRQLVELIKTDYPEIALRTTFIVGYPGETRKQFKKLCNFVKETKFEYAGFFPYSREPNTVSYFLKKQRSNFTKKLRTKKISKLQHNIALDYAKNHIGQKVNVLVDYFDEMSGEFCGHSEKASPSLDFGVRFVDNGNVKTGEISSVEITDFDGTDFRGEIV